MYLKSKITKICFCFDFIPNTFLKVSKLFQENHWSWIIKWNRHEENCSQIL